MSNKLTAKQRKFVDEYIKLGNVTQAAINAGYSKKTAAVVGSENLKKPNIQKAIEKRMKSKDKKAIASQDEVLEYLTSVMRGEPQKVHNKTVKISNGKRYENETKGTFTPTEEARIDAAKELSKRYVVANNEEAKARVRKIKAEAEIAEAKAKLLKDTENQTAEQISKLLDTFSNEV